MKMRSRSASGDASEDSTGVNVPNLANKLRTKLSREIETLHSRSSIGEACLWVLRAAKDSASVPRLSARQIHGTLSELEYACSANSVAVAMTRASNREVVAYREGGEVRYGIAHKGRELLDRTDPVRMIRVWSAEVGNQWAAWLKLRELSDEVSGELAITDPYFGAQSLQKLEMLGSRKEKVRLLTSQVTSKKGTSKAVVEGMARALQKQHPNIEIRVVPPPAPFHDRYVISKNLLTFVGHGLESLGEKESFVIQLHSNLVPDTVSALRASFEQRWAGASPV